MRVEHGETNYVCSESYASLPCHAFSFAIPILFSTIFQLLPTHYTSFFCISSSFFHLFAVVRYSRCISWDWSRFFPKMMQMFFHHLRTGACMAWHKNSKTKFLPRPCMWRITTRGSTRSSARFKRCVSSFIRYTRRKAKQDGCRRCLMFFSSFSQGIPILSVFLSRRCSLHPFHTAATAVAICTEGVYLSHMNTRHGFHPLFSGRDTIVFNKAADSPAHVQFNVLLVRTSIYFESSRSLMIDCIHED